MTNPFGNPQDNDGAITFEVDLSNETGSTTIPEGDYIGRLVNLEKTTSKAGNPMWVWDFAITEGEYAGMEFRLFTAITPAALWKLAETLEALGVGGFGQAIKFTTEEVLNTLVVMHVYDDDYNGQLRSQLDGITAHPNGAGTKYQNPNIPPTSAPATTKGRNRRNASK